MGKKSTIIPEVRKRISSAGGKGRASKLSKERRYEIARKAALSRWANKRSKSSLLQLSVDVNSTSS